MTMYGLLIISLLTLFLFGCSQTRNENTQHQTVQTEIHYDTAIIVVLPYDSIEISVFEGATPTELTASDFENIENLLTKCINEYNPSQEKQFQKINTKLPQYHLDKNDFIIDLKRYKRQYISVKNRNGEKEVWINCFCGKWGSTSKTSIVVVLDGGNCFFNLKVNLTNGKYYDLMVNGVA